jgi:hypothetical protein
MSKRSLFGSLKFKRSSSSSSSKPKQAAAAGDALGERQLEAAGTHEAAGFTISAATHSSSMLGRLKLRRTKSTAPAAAGDQADAVGQFADEQQEQPASGSRGMLGTGSKQPGGARRSSPMVMMERGSSPAELELPEELPEPDAAGLEAAAAAAAAAAPAAAAPPKAGFLGGLLRPRASRAASPAVAPGLAARNVTPSQASQTSQGSQRSAPSPAAPAAATEGPASKKGRGLFGSLGSKRAGVAGVFSLRTATPDPSDSAASSAAHDSDLLDSAASSERQQPRQGAGTPKTGMSQLRSKLFGGGRRAQQQQQQQQPDSRQISFGQSPSPLAAAAASGSLSIVASRGQAWGTSDGQEVAAPGGGAGTAAAAQAPAAVAEADEPGGSRDQAAVRRLVGDQMLGGLEARDLVASSESERGSESSETGNAFAAMLVPCETPTRRSQDGAEGLAAQRSGSSRGSSGGGSQPQAGSQGSGRGSQDSPGAVLRSGGSDSIEADLASDGSGGAQAAGPGSLGATGAAYQQLHGQYQGQYHGQYEDEEELYEEEEERGSSQLYGYAPPADPYGAPSLSIIAEEAEGAEEEEGSPEVSPTQLQHHRQHHLLALSAISEATREGEDSEAAEEPPEPEERPQPAAQRSHGGGAYGLGGEEEGGGQYSDEVEEEGSVLYRLGSSDGEQGGQLEEQAPQQPAGHLAAPRTAPRPSTAAWRELQTPLAAPTPGVAASLAAPARATGGYAGSLSSGSDGSGSVHCYDDAGAESPMAAPFDRQRRPAAGANSSIDFGRSPLPAATSSSGDAPSDWQQSYGGAGPAAASGYAPASADLELLQREAELQRQMCANPLYTAAAPPQLQLQLQRAGGAPEPGAGPGPPAPELLEGQGSAGGSGSEGARQRGVRACMHARAAAAAPCLRARPAAAPCARARGPAGAPACPGAATRVRGGRSQGGSPLQRGHRRCAGSSTGASRP